MKDYDAIADATQREYLEEKEITRLKSKNAELKEALIIAMARFPMNKETESEFDKCMQALKRNGKI